MKKKIEKIDIATLFLSLVMLISFLIPSFVSFLKSRVNMPEPVSAKMILGNWYWIGIAMILFFIVMSVIKKDNELLNFLTGLVANLFLAGMVLLVSMRYEFIPYEHMNSSRMSFGVGYVLMIIALYGITITCGNYLNRKWMKFINSGLGWVLIIIFLFTGYLDNYAVMKEYEANDSTFGRNVRIHISMCLKALFAAIIIGIPTGYWCYRHHVADKVIIFILSIFETIPMLALFAIIRIPCAALGEKFPVLQGFGVGSHGISVSVIALTLYALYLIVFNSRAAFATIDKEYIETAFAMGMSPKQVFMKIQFPLALPIILGGIRLAMINTFTAASLAASFGGGGLGSYINIGINGSALDCQLLAVIPIFALTVVADLLMKAIIYVIQYLLGGNRHDNTAKCV